MPAHDSALLDDSVEIEMTIDGERFVIQLPRELLGAYLIG